MRIVTSAHAGRTLSESPSKTVPISMFSDILNKYFSELVTGFFQSTQNCLENLKSLLEILI